MNLGNTTCADMEEYLASLYMTSRNSVQPSDVGSDSSDEIEIVRELKVSLEEHNCELCYEGTFLVDKLLQFGGITDHEHKYACEVCDKAFKSKSKLSKHLKLHKGDMSEDTECTRESSTSAEGVEAWTCSKCFLRCKSAKGLRRHTTNQHSSFCSKCVLKFSNFNDFNVHMSAHMKSSRLLTCPSCNKKFMYQKSLKDHVCSLVTLT